MGYCSQQHAIEPRDILGNLIAPGDYFAYAQGAGKGAVTRIFQFVGVELAKPRWEGDDPTQQERWAIAQSIFYPSFGKLYYDGDKKPSRLHMDLFDDHALKIDDTQAAIELALRLPMKDRPGFGKLVMREGVPTPRKESDVR